MKTAQSFKAASSDLAVVDLKSKAAQGKYLEQATTLFFDQHPESKGYEDFKDQLGPKGFFHALVDKQAGTVHGIAAGVILGRTLKTAAITYVVTDKDHADNARPLVEKTLNDLQKKEDLRAAYVELKEAPNKRTKSYERDKAEKDLYESLGAVKVPVLYSQPYDVDNDDVIKGLELRALFLKPDMTARGKSDLTMRHLDRMVALYDPGYQNKKNREQLDFYAMEMGIATGDPSKWGMESKGAKAAAPRKDI